MRLIADTIHDQGLTVVAAQEIRRRERDAILGRLSGAHSLRWGYTAQRQGADDTMILFDKAVWELKRQVYYKIPMQAGLNDRFQIGAMLRHKKTGQRVWFYSVHFAAGGAAGAAARKTGAQKTLASIKANPIANDQPLVLGGDFNSATSDPPARVLSGSGLMKDARARADRRVGNGCKTLNSSAGSAGRQSCPGGAARHIDQVWVSKPGMQVLKYQVTATAHTSRSSDHNPVTTILLQKL